MIRITQPGIVGRELGESGLLGVIAGIGLAE
jgi:hypothetical protein